MGFDKGSYLLVLDHGELLTVLKAATSSSSPHTVRGDSNVFIFVLLGFLPLLSQPVIILDELYHLFHLLTHIDALIFAILIWTQTRTHKDRQLKQEDY